MSGSSVQIMDGRDVETAAQQAGAVFAQGGMVIFPTETVYGVGASILHDEGYASLLALKQRQDGKPFTIHIPSAAEAGRYVDTTDPMLARLIRKVFPGPVTLIVKVPGEVRKAKLEQIGLSPDQENRIYFDGTVGLRCPSDYLARLVLASTDDPIAAASANHRGDPPPHDCQQATEAIGDEVQLAIDGGRTRFAKPSTIIRVDFEDGRYDFTVEREGVYDARYIRKLMNWTMLLVCSGNTCRSPMAEAIARQQLASRKQMAEDKLGEAGYRILSAGVFAAPGMPASAEASEALQPLGIDLSQHRSRQLTLDLINQADVIFCMTADHRDAIVSFAAEASEKTHLLDPEGGNIADPIGAGLDVYKQTADTIRRHLNQRLEEQQI